MFAYIIRAHLNVCSCMDWHYEVTHVRIKTFSLLISPLVCAHWYFILQFGLYICMLLQLRFSYLV